MRKNGAKILKEKLTGKLLNSFTGKAFFFTDTIFFIAAILYIFIP